MKTGEDIIRRHDALTNERSVWDAFWQEIADYVMPRKAEIAWRSQSYPSAQREATIFDNTAIRANQTFASGLMSWMMPYDGSWFLFEPPPEFARYEEVKEWFSAASQTIRNLMALSNFYEIAHEALLDTGAFGTSVLHVEPGQRRPFVFSNWDVGTYAIAEDNEGIVDTLFRTLTFTARQAVMEFGLSKCPEEIQQAVRDNDAKKLDSPHEFVHGIYPRDPRDVDLESLMPVKFPYASCYVAKRSKEIVKESGFFERPFSSARFLRWGRSPYGYSPAWIALPEARQLNFLEKQLDALAEIAAFPRILLPANFEGGLDLRAGMPTWRNPADASGQEPKEWLTGGRYDVGLDRSNRKRKAIEDAFFVPVFRMFEQLDEHRKAQMTALEVSERASEKLTQFSPFAGRIQTEMLTPTLERVFSLAVRMPGVLPVIPDVFVQSGGVPTPKVVYSSRIALAAKMAGINAFDAEMNFMAPLMQFDSSIADIYNFDLVARDRARARGIPNEWVRPDREVKQIRAARAAAQEQQAQLQATLAMAKAAGDAGKVRPDSPVLQLMEGSGQ